ncbi:MAG: hypothetical protein PHP83_00300 [Clostridia bacterium]|nr:hypothetical protein [Clostridia bacterium]
MEKIAVIQLGINEVKLSILNYTTTGFFIIDQEITENVKICQDMERDGYLKPTRIAETIEILKIFRRIIDMNKIENTICFADNAITQARNQIAFLDEIYKTVSLFFKILTQEDKVTAIHNAILNSFSIPKGVILQIADNTCDLVHYNRRVVLNSASLNFGANTLAEKFINEKNPEEKMQKMVDYCLAELKNVKWFGEIEEEYEFIGIGKIFESVGKLCRKSTHYPLDLSHNYCIKNENFMQVFKLVSALDLDNSKKLKGISDMRVDVLAAGMAIVKSAFATYACTPIHVSTCGEMYGIISKTLISQSMDKPLLDVLGYSLSSINEFYPTGKCMSNVYDIAIILYRQLKVLHKLSRTFLKILRIAASMSMSGKRISFNNYEKNCFPVICNSAIYGASHQEIVLAAFIASCQNIDEFSLNDWVQFKDIVEEEDVEAVKKLAVIVKLATLLNITGSNYVKDISCDVLGDTVILKTEVEKDASLEISQGMKVAFDFKKAFKKNLQIL